MKNVLSSLAFAALAVPAWSAQQTVTLSIPTMNCAACPITVRKALTRLEGVVSVKSDLDKRQTTVVFDDARVNLAAITQATKEAGFPSTVSGDKP
jgi:mercuric ion binding protein